MANNDTPKKENPLLMGILMTVLGIILCFFGKSHDLVLFQVIELDGKYAFPILGGILILFGIVTLVDFIKKKKK